MPFLPSAIVMIPDIEKCLLNARGGETIYDDATGKPLGNLYELAAAEIAHFRAALAASTAREAVMLVTLRLCEAALELDESDCAYITMRQQALDSIADILRKPSPGAEKLLAVVEAARKLNKAYVNNAINDGWCIAIEYFEGLRSEIAALDTQEPEHG